MVRKWLVGSLNQRGVVKADWHLEELSELPAVTQERPYDPFMDPAYRAPLPPIDLSTPNAQLRQAIDDLLLQEKRLFEEDIRCPIKDHGETTCLACPVSASRDTSDPRGRLCRVGQEQERVSTVWIAQQSSLANGG